MMRAVILALALVFGIANTPATLDTRMDALIEAGDERGAVALAQAEADRGNPEAHDWLGWFNENGRGMPVDFGLAEFHYRIAARGSSNHAAWRLGVLIDSGQVRAPLEEAVAFFRAAAERDYPSAIVSLAVMQATGRGTAQDHAAAMGNYMRAARLGDSHGVRGVGVMLHLGEGVARDDAEAAAWFLVAAAMGNGEADANLERLIGAMPDIDMRVVGRRALAIAEKLGIEVPIFVEEDEPAAPTVG